MLRELLVLAILIVFLTQSTTGKENPRGKCYQYNNGTKPAPLNCCNREVQQNPCDTVRCRDGQICELVPISTNDGDICDDERLPLKPRCRVKCERPKKCKKGCYLVKDINECNFCYCDANFTNPCTKNNPCNKSELCTLQQVHCIKAPCYPIVKCKPRVQCPRFKKCHANCLKYKDVDGCSRCHCCNNCVTKKCPRRKKCVLEKVTCIRCPCPPLAQCI